MHVFFCKNITLNCVSAAFEPNSSVKQRRWFKNGRKKMVNGRGGVIWKTRGSWLKLRDLPLPISSCALSWRMDEWRSSLVFSISATFSEEQRLLLNRTPTFDRSSQRSAASKFVFYSSNYSLNFCAMISRECQV